MSAARVYLDHNATAPLRPEARTAMVGALDVVGNPSSVHWEGRQARRIVEDAREQVAALVGAEPADVVFTSGATEANNWVLSQNWQTVILPKIEHDSVLAPARAGGARVIELAADHTGQTDVAAIAEHVLCSDLPLDGTLVTMQLANNETGVVQPLADVGSLLCGPRDLDSYRCRAGRWPHGHRFWRTRRRQLEPVVTQDRRADGCGRTDPG